MSIQISADLLDVLLQALDGPLPEFERNHAKVQLALARRRARKPLRLAYAGSEAYETAAGTWTPGSAPGAAVLGLLVLNPERWIALRPDRSARAWRAAVARARESLLGVDAALAGALCPARSAGSAGVRFRTRDRVVEVFWRRPSWVAMP